MKRPVQLEHGRTYADARYICLILNRHFNTYVPGLQKHLCDLYYTIFSYIFSVREQVYNIL